MKRTTAFRVVHHRRNVSGALLMSSKIELKLSPVTLSNRSFDRKYSILLQKVKQQLLRLHDFVKLRNVPSVTARHTIKPNLRKLFYHLCFTTLKWKKRKWTQERCHTKGKATGSGERMERKVHLSTGHNCFMTVSTHILLTTQQIHF